MRIQKVALVVFAVAATSLAAITGRVTDTSGSAPIGGAIVKLETAGIADTTDTNGNFTLLVGSTGLNLQQEQFSPRPYTASITGRTLRMNLAENGVAALAVFDLGGKMLLQTRYSFDAGFQTITLPRRTSGIYMYRLTVGGNEYVFRGGSIGEAFVADDAVTTVPNSKNGISAKVSKISAATHDVLTISKDGYLNYRIAITSYDTNGMAIMTIASAGTVTDGNGNVYQTVKLGNQEWTAENLRATKYSDGSAIPLVTDSASWSNRTLPGVCFFNFTTNPDTIRRLGGLYNWPTVDPANSGKVAPTGWHVSTKAEWDTLQNFLIANGYNWDGSRSLTSRNKLAKALSAATDWIGWVSDGSIGNVAAVNNSTGFSAEPGGYIDPLGSWPDPTAIFGNYSVGGYGAWWTSTEVTPGSPGSGAYACELYYRQDWVGLGMAGNEGSGYSVRLVKD